MLPVARANLDHICCVCLLDIRPSMFTKKVYDVIKEKNMSKILKLTAHITILKNPINQKYINDYCRKICEICFVKTQYSYIFREKIMASTATLKELLESGDTNEQDIELLRFFCRICLNRQKTNDIKYLNMTHLNWLKDCSGIRFTSLIDNEAFRIKEGTNINEIALVNDRHFPQQLCPECFKKLQNVEEFRKSATQSFEYMISVMGDASLPEDYLVTQGVKQFKENIILTKESPVHPVLVNTKSATLNIEYQNEQEHSSTDNVQNPIDETCSYVESMINIPPNYSSIQELEYDTFEEVMELMDDLPHYSDNSDEDFTLNLNNEFADCNDNANKSICLRKTRAKTSKQCNINKRNLKSKEEDENAFKPNVRRKQSKKKLEESKKLTESAKKPKENDEASLATNANKTEVEISKETFVCEECSKIFATRRACKRHHRRVHIINPNQTMHECLICSKKFKRKSHLTDHIKTVHEKLRPFKCAHCPKTFSAKSSKRVHELSHTGDYPFVCKWCGKGFRQSSQLKIHSEIHTTNPELLCPICKRSQKSQNDLENHLQAHNDKRLQCPLCGKLFTRSHHLKDHHNAVHLKLRPFKCEFCELAFGDRKTRLVHEKSHTEERPITCSVCKSGFKTIFSLSRHVNQFGHKTENYENEIKNKTKKKKSKSISPHYTEKFHSTFEL